MWSLKPKAYLNLWGDALICLLLNPEWQLLPHIRHASLMLPNCSEIPQNHPKKRGLRILFIDAMCSTRQFIAAAAYWTKEPRAMCLCYSCFWWKHMLIYLFTEKRGMGKGHQLTSQHGRQYGSQFACSSTCYLLKASRRSARSAARPVSPHGQRSFLHIVPLLRLLTPFCARFRGALQQICFLWGSLLKIPDWKLLQKPRGWHVSKTSRTEAHAARLPCHTCHSPQTPALICCPTPLACQVSFPLLCAEEPQRYLLLLPVPTTALEVAHGMKWIPGIFLGFRILTFVFQNTSLAFQTMKSYLQAVLVQQSLSDLWTHFPHNRDTPGQTLRATTSDSGCPPAAILHSINKWHY